MWWIFLFTLFCIALFVCIALVWWSQKRLGLPRGGALGRIANWAEGVRSSEAEVKTATVGDLVLFVTLYVIGVTFVITLYIGINSGSEERSKQQIEDLTRQTQGQLQQLKADDQELKELRQRSDRPEQEFPGADEEIIGGHVAFRWGYRNHNDASRYVLQLMKIATEREQQEGGGAQQLPVGQLCTFAATDSADQRSQLPTQEIEARGGELAPGTYMWRVASGELGRRPNDNFIECVQDDQIRYWSAFRKFTFFPSQNQRIRTTGTIIVGTQFGQDTPFSKLGEDGKPSGFEMDLIRVVVEGCLLVVNGEVQFDEPACKAAVAKECEAIENEPNEPANVRAMASPCKTAETVAGTTSASTANPAPGKNIQMRLVPLPPGVSSTEALQNRNIDLYIGSRTKAIAREKGHVVFSDEYLTYETQIVVDRNETCSDVHCLATNGRKIGVVEETSNAWLANELKQKDLKDLSIVPMASLALLENAFEKQDVTAVIVDGTTAPFMGSMSPKLLNDDLRQQKAWRAYLHDFIGHDEREGYAIATVDDISEKRGSTEHSDEPDAEDPAKRQRLLTELNKALRSQAAKMLLDVLYHKYDLDQWNAARPRNDSMAWWNRAQAIMGMFGHN
jgi:ABC-type amino acid transport substrate-binding protein